MSVSRTGVIPLSTETQVEPGAVCADAGQAPPPPTPAGESNGETVRPQNAPNPASGPQDVVKMQWDGMAQLDVYQFVNPEGTLIVQIPSQQMLNIAREISQQIAQGSANKEPVVTEGGKDHGH